MQKTKPNTFLLHSLESRDAFNIVVGWGDSVATINKFTLCGDLMNN